MQAELTHIPVSPRTRNILLAIGLGLILLIFWKAPTLPKLLLTGMAVALILSFPVKYLSKIIPRGIAIALVVIALLALLVVGAIVLVPLAADQLAGLAEQAPRLLDQAYGWARRVVENLAARGLLDTTPDRAMADLQRTGAERVNGLLGDVVTRAFDTLSGTVGGVFTTLSVILIAAYLLADGERFKLGAIRFLPVQYRDDALVLFSDVIETLSRYLSGLLVSLTFQGVASTIALTILGVPFAILLGIWTAIGAIVPFIGSYIGGIPATIVAFTVSPTTGILTALTYVLINFVDGNLIAPRVQGNAIRVSPLFVFLAVIAGGQIAGIWGALMAVPTLAVVRVVFDFLMERLVVVPQTLDPLPVALVDPPSDATTTSLKALNASGAAAGRAVAPRG
ncbi:MAG TPA: AI-2E family transporter [Thermomicrobiales bacterium]|jgi:predicted PurR-regulated permease PerM|nr:AI-2E family transporter [Thermomicrobiales bacterium]